MLVRGAIPLIFATLLATRELEDVYVATAMGVFICIGYVGSFISPIIGDALVEWHGPISALLLLAFCLVHSLSRVLVYLLAYRIFV